MYNTHGIPFCTSHGTLFQLMNDFDFVNDSPRKTDYPCVINLLIREA